MRKHMLENFGVSLPEWLAFSETPEKVYAFACEMPSGIEFEETRGVTAGKQTKLGFKPSTEFIQIFGDMATRNVIFVSREEAEKIIKGEGLETNNPFAKQGYVIVFSEGLPLACALLKAGKLINQIAKAKRV